MLILLLFIPLLKQAQENYLLPKLVINNIQQVFFNCLCGHFHMSVQPFPHWFKSLRMHRIFTQDNRELSCKILLYIYSHIFHSGIIEAHFCERIHFSMRHVNGKNRATIHYLRQRQEEKDSHTNITQMDGYTAKILLLLKCTANSSHVCDTKITNLMPFIVLHISANLV